MKAALPKILFMWEKLAGAVAPAAVKGSHEQMPTAWE